MTQQFSKGTKALFWSVALLVTSMNTLELITWHTAFNFVGVGVSAFHLGMIFQEWVEENK